MICSKQLFDINDMYLSNLIVEIKPTNIFNNCFKFTVIVYFIDFFYKYYKHVKLNYSTAKHNYYNHNFQLIGTLYYI